MFVDWWWKAIAPQLLAVFLNETVMASSPFHYRWLKLDAGRPSNLDDVVVQPELLDPGIRWMENEGVVSKATIERVRAAVSVQYIVAASAINHLITLEKPQAQRR